MIAFAHKRNEKRHKRLQKRMMHFQKLMQNKSRAFHVNLAYSRHWQGAASAHTLQDLIISNNQTCADQSQQT